MSYWELATLFVSLAVQTMSTGLAPEPKVLLGATPESYLPPESHYPVEVSLGGYHFEAEEGTGRARIVVTYSHPFGNPAEYDPGPAPTIAQIPGLFWDSGAGAVVYEAGGRRTVCAVTESGRSTKLKNTGACVVAAEPSVQTVDDGWRIHRYRMIDTWFEVR